MSFTNKQAAELALTTDSNLLYTPPTDAQIRAFTVHNPTGAAVNYTVEVNALAMVSRSIAAGATEVVSTLFNQQLQADEPLTMTGEGLNVMVTVVEITG